jgi:hypothetical protein
MQSQKSKPNLDNLINLYLQAKLDGNKRLMGYYSAIITRLGGKLPKN